MRDIPLTTLSMEMIKMAATFSQQTIGHATGGAHVLQTVADRLGTMDTLSRLASWPVAGVAPSAKGTPLDYGGHAGKPKMDSQVYDRAQTLARMITGDSPHGGTLSRFLSVPPMAPANIGNGPSFSNGNGDFKPLALQSAQR